MNNIATPENLFNNTKDDVVVIVGGFPRSGTTAISDMLNESADIAIMSEYHVGDLIRDTSAILNYGHGLAGGHTSILNDVSRPDAPQPSPTDPINIESLITYEPFKTPDLNFSLRYPNDAKFGLIIGNIVKTALGKPTAQVIGSKTPGSMQTEADRRVGELFPLARYIVMLRSPDGQINSSLNRRNREILQLDAWHIQSIEQAIDEYCQVACGLIALKAQFGDAVLFVKYEDMIADQSKVYERIAKHLGLDWQPERSFVYENRGTIEILSVREREILDQRLGHICSSWNDTVLTGTSTEVDLSIFDPVLPNISYQKIQIGDYQPNFLGEGWSPVETDFMWTNQESATLVFGPAEHEEMLFKIEFAPYLASGNPILLRLYVNDQESGKPFLLCPGAGISGDSPYNLVAVPDWNLPMSLWFGPIKLHSSQRNLFEFRMSGLSSPRSLGHGSDDRLLGISLRALQFSPVPR